MNHSAPCNVFMNGIPWEWLVYGKGESRGVLVAASSGKAPREAGNIHRAHRPQGILPHITAVEPSDADGMRLIEQAVPHLRMAYGRVRDHRLIALERDFVRGRNDAVDHAVFKIEVYLSDIGMALSESGFFKGGRQAVPFHEIERSGHEPRRDFLRSGKLELPQVVVFEIPQKPRHLLLG